MILSYQHAADMIPEEQITGEAYLCEVKLDGLMIGDTDVYGTVSAYMIYDASTECFEPDYVIASVLEDGQENQFKADNNKILEAMTAAFERFDNYFNNDNVREID